MPRYACDALYLRFENVLELLGYGLGLDLYEILLLRDDEVPLVVRASLEQLVGSRLLVQIAAH